MKNFNRLYIIRKLILTLILFSATLTSQAHGDTLSDFINSMDLSRRIPTGEEQSTAREHLELEVLKAGQIRIHNWIVNRLQLIQEGALPEMASLKLFDSESVERRQRNFPYNSFLELLIKQLAEVIEIPLNGMNEDVPFCPQVHGVDLIRTPTLEKSAPIYICHRAFELAHDPDYFAIALVKEYVRTLGITEDCDIYALTQLIAPSQKVHQYLENLNTNCD